MTYCRCPYCDRRTELSNVPRQTDDPRWICESCWRSRCWNPLRPDEWTAYDDGSGGLLWRLAGEGARLLRAADWRRRLTRCATRS